MTLYKNALIKWNEQPPRVERVLHVDMQTDQAVTYDMAVNSEGNGPLPRWQSLQALEEAVRIGAAKIIIEDPYGQLQDSDNGFQRGNHGRGYVFLRDEDIPTRYKECRDKIWKDLSPHVAGMDILTREGRGDIIDALRSKNWSTPTCYKYFRRWWQAGQCRNAFLPRYDLCGGRGKERLLSENDRHAQKSKRGRPSRQTRLTGQRTGVNVTKEMRAILKHGFREILKDNQGMPFRAAFQLLNQRYFSKEYEVVKGRMRTVLLPPNERPTAEQARYWYAKDLGLLHTLQCAESTREWNLKRRALTGDTSQMAFGPGSLFQIDATLVDIYLVSEINPNQWIGRPVLYIVIDVFSRLIVGFYVGLENPSWNTALAALRNAVTEKTAYWKSLEMDDEITESEWPSHHLPEAILADRGEFAGSQPDALVNDLNIMIHTAAAYRADWKGIVERQFGLLNYRTVQWTPGATYDQKKRGGRDYRLDATLTLPQFRKIMALHIYDHNNCRRLFNYPFDQFMITDDVAPYPVKLWEWGIRNRNGALREASVKVLEPRLLPSDSASVTERGIEFRGLYYTTPLAERQRWCVRSRAAGRRKINVVYDPADTSTLYVRVEGVNRFEKCVLLGKSETFADRHWDDVLDYFERKKLGDDRARPTDEQNQSSIEEKKQKIVAEAKKASERGRVPKSKAALIAEQAGNRKNERTRDRMGKNPKSPAVKDQSVLEPPQQDNDDYVPRSNKRGVLQEA